MNLRPWRVLGCALLLAACSSVLGIEEGQLDPALDRNVLTAGQDSGGACIPFDNAARLSQPFDHLLPLPD